MSKSLLITGATGKQGGAVISALLAQPAASSFNIIALTRHASSPAAQALAAKSPSIEIVTGDLDNPNAIFASVSKPIWGVFSVQAAMGGGASPESEERQGKALIDAAVANKVSQFVYSSADRHGEKSGNNETNVPHLASKYRIEKYLEKKAAASSGETNFTILRPVFFMDNLAPGFAGKLTASWWKLALGSTKKLQLVATEDIGHFAAQSFIHPEEHKNKALSLAGDELTFDEANEVYKSKTGNNMPTTFKAIGWMLLNAISEMRLMFGWFKIEGCAADIESLRKAHPKLVNFGNWIERKGIAMSR